MELDVTLLDIALRVLFIVLVVSMLVKLESMEKRLPKNTQEPNKYKQTKESNPPKPYDKLNEYKQMQDMQALSHACFELQYKLANIISVETLLFLNTPKELVRDHGFVLTLAIRNGEFHLAIKSDTIPLTFFNISNHADLFDAAWNNQDYFYRVMALVKSTHEGK